LNKQLVLILDFGGQYTQLIARCIRESNVYCEIETFDISVEKIKKINPKAIILSGGSSSIYDKDAPQLEDAIYGLGIPILGICYGMQIMAYQLGGVVIRNEVREYGITALNILHNVGLFLGLESESDVLMSHSDTVIKLPIDFNVTAYTKKCAIAAFENPKLKLFGLQFHPEVKHSIDGMKILQNFLFKEVGLEADWNMPAFIEESIQQIREMVSEDTQVICGLSGGVDSSVAAALVHKAIGDRLTCIFVDHGLLRQNEADQVMEIFADSLKIKVIKVDASESFLSKLSGVTDPELKRKIIGDEFIRTFEREALRLGKVDYLVQGTVYPDVIESGTAATTVIKSHHNVGGLPKDMKFKLIEPLRQLFKDEVRKVGEELGLPKTSVWRHPFPGPGLGIRVLGEVTKEKLDILRQADAITIDVIRKSGLYDEIWQAFAVLPDIRSVGVMGDNRTYAHTIAIRAVTGTDGMTAEWYKFPYEVLNQISTRIVNEVAQVNRVVYDITSKPPSTIEWE